MRSLRGILLDIDGTLVDSNDAHARAWVDALSEESIEVPFAKVRRLIGMGGDKLLPSVSNISEDTPQGQKLSKRRKEVFREKYLPTLKPTPGAQDLLVHLKSRGFRLIVATSAKKDELTPLLKVCGGDRLVDLATTSDDADNSKPDPDIIYSALQLGELNPAEVVMLGDTPYDISAAGKAKVKVIAFRSGGWKDQDLDGALAIYDHPADLLTKFDSSPLASADD